MNEFLAWLEASTAGEAMRASGVWTYGLINLAHILGVSSLFGSLLVLDLRLLGVWPSVALTAIEKPTVPIAIVGFAVAAVSGVFMIATNATEYAGNPFVYIKFPAIGIGALNFAALSFLPAWRARQTRAPTVRERRQLAAAGGVSLVCWLTAISAARMIGYW